MDPNNQDGNPDPNGQAQPSNPNPQDNPQPQNQPPQIPSEVKEQLEALQRERDLLKQSAAHWQSQADRMRNVALGNQPDPQQQHKQYIQRLAEEMNIHPKDVERISTLIQMTTQPLQQELQTLKMSQMNSTLVDGALRAAFQQNPELLADPEIFGQTEAQIRQIASTGQQGSLDDYTKMALYTAGGLKAMKPPAQQQNNPNPQQPIHPFNFRSMSGIPQSFGGKNPEQQKAPAPQTDATREFAALIKSRMEPKKSA